MSEITPALTAAVDQAHAAAEDILTGLIEWWTNRQTRPLTRAEEVALLTHLLAGKDTTALLATAICRLADKASQ